MPRWLASAGMVLTWAVWMFGSAVHYTFLPRCLSRSLGSVVQFAILQAALTGIVSWIMRRDRTRQQPGKLKQQQGLLLDKFDPSLQVVAARTDGPGGGGGPPSSLYSSSPSSQPSPPASSAATTAGHDGRANILIAGAAFAVAITMTNASVAYGSVAGSRMVKSLEPAIVAGLQLLAGMDSRADFPWVCLLAFAVSMMLAVAPTGITLLSASAALLSTAGISTRNVFVKKHMLALKASAAAAAAAVAPTAAMTATSTKATAVAAVAKTATTTTAAPLSTPPPPQPGPSSSASHSSVDVQTHLNFVACAILIAFASAHAGVLVGGSGKDTGSVSSPAPALAGTSTDLVIACASFAGFQVAALMVLERVTPTRQAAIKSLQNAITTGWALLIDTTGHGRHNSLEVVPALAWGICVVALASGAQLTLKGSPWLGRWLPVLPARWTEGAGSLAARKKGGEGPSCGGGDHAGGVEIVVVTSAIVGAAGVVAAAKLCGAAGAGGGGAGGAGGAGGGGGGGGGASNRGGGGDTGDSALGSGAVVDANAGDDPIVIKGPWGSTCSSSGPAKGPAIARPRDAGRVAGAGGGATSSASVARVAWRMVYCACLAALLLQATLMGVARFSFDRQRARFGEYGDQGQARLVGAGSVPRVVEAAAARVGRVTAIAAASTTTGTSVHFPALF